MHPQDRFEMTRAMRQHGGSFVRALAECFALADSSNLDRLVAAFPEYIEQYSAIASSDAASRALAWDAEKQEHAE